MCYFGKPLLYLPWWRRTQHDRLATIIHRFDTVSMLCSIRFSYWCKHRCWSKIATDEKNQLTIRLNSIGNTKCYQICFEAPHFRTAHILIFECDFNGVQCNCCRINRPHHDFWISWQIKCRCYAGINADHIFAQIEWEKIENCILKNSIEFFFHFFHLWFLFYPLEMTWFAKAIELRHLQANIFRQHRQSLHRDDLLDSISDLQLFINGISNI